MTDDYSATALWLAPDASHDEDGLMALVDTVAPGKRGDMGAVIEEMGRYHPTEPHWYLPFIGVVPSGKVTVWAQRFCGEDLRSPMRRSCPRTSNPQTHGTGLCTRGTASRQL